jgi:hypothetical protein
MLAWQIDTVCQLRLGQVGATIEYLENAIDWNIASLARSADMKENDYRYNILSAAKTYREIVPSCSPITDIVNDILNDIKKMDSFEYDSPLCSLVKSTECQKNL